MSLETELDRLFQVPPAAFVAERNALATALRKGGDSAGAEQVARLARPSPVAWVVNQLQFKARAELDELRARGAALRRAQEEHFDADDFAARRRAHQDALRAAMDRALAIAAEGGFNRSAGFERRLESTLNLVAAATELSPPPGRMQVELESLGFDALTAAAPGPAPRPKRAARVVDTEREETRATVKAALDAASREVRRLEQEAATSAAKYQRAVREAEDAAERARLATHACDEARAQAETARGRLASAESELAAARRAYEELSGETTPGSA